MCEIIVLSLVLVVLFVAVGVWCRRCVYSDFNKLHGAVFENNVVEAIRLIQKCPGAINRLHPVDGYSAFMRASRKGSTQLVNVMIQFGGDVSVKSVKGESPFYLAVFHHIECPYKEDATCIRALYYAGCDVNATNDKGIAPIHLAANFGHTNLVRWLLKKGASPNLQPYPYLLAQMNGHTVTARLLQNYQLRAIEQAE